MGEQVSGLGEQPGCAMEGHGAALVIKQVRLRLNLGSVCLSDS